MINFNKPKIKGTSFVLISSLFFGTYGVWSHFMAKSFGIFSQAWTRGLIFLVLVLLFNLKFEFLKPILKKDLIWFLILGLCGGLNQAPYFFGFKHLNVGTATTLFYIALVIGGYIIGKIFFNEKITKTKWLSLFLAILGILAIYKLVLNPSQFLAASLTIFAGLLGATAVCLSKKISGNYNEVQILMGYFIFTTVINLPLAIILKDNLPVLTDKIWLFQFGYMAAFFIANFSVIEGMKYLEASIGSLIGLAEIIFGIIFGVIFFKETISIGTVIGSILIIISAVLPNIKIKNRAF